MVLDPAGLIAAPPPSGPVDSMAPSIGSRADPVPRKLEMDSSRSDSKDAPTTPNFEPCTGIAKGHVRDEVINHYSSIAYGVRQRPSLMLTRGIEHFPSLDACFAPAQVLSLNTMRMRQKTQSYDEGRICPSGVSVEWIGSCGTSPNALFHPGLRAKTQSNPCFGDEGMPGGSIGSDLQHVSN